MELNFLKHLELLSPAQHCHRHAARRRLIPAETPPSGYATEIDSDAPHDGNREGSGSFRRRWEPLGRVRNFAGDDTRMAELTGYAASPFAFIFRYVRLRPISH